MQALRQQYVTYCVAMPANLELRCKVLRGELNLATKALKEAREISAEQVDALEKRANELEELHKKLAQQEAEAEVAEAAHKAKVERITDAGAKRSDALEAKLAIAEAQVASGAIIDVGMREHRIDTSERITSNSLMGDRNGALGISDMRTDSLQKAIRGLQARIDEEMIAADGAGNEWKDKLDEPGGKVLRLFFTTLSDQLALMDGAGTTSYDESGEIFQTTPLITMLEHRLGGYLCDADIKAINAIAYWATPRRITDAENAGKVERITAFEALLILWDAAFGNTAIACESIFLDFSAICDPAKIDERGNKDPRLTCLLIDKMVDRLYSMASNGRTAMQFAMYRMALPRHKYSNVFSNLTDAQAATPRHVMSKLHQAWKDAKAIKDQRRAAEEARKNAAQVAKAAKEAASKAAERKRERDAAVVAATEIKDAKRPRAEMPPGKCRKCFGKPGYNGHKASKCPEKNCYLCQKPGHVRADCPNLKQVKAEKNADGNGAAPGDTAGVGHF